MMISAVGKKKNTAASTHKLMDEVPLCAAAAIQRGPSTAAMLNSSTSQKPMARRNCDFGAVSSAIHSFPIEQAPSFYREGQFAISCNISQIKSCREFPLCATPVLCYSSPHGQPFNDRCRRHARRPGRICAGLYYD